MEVVALVAPDVAENAYQVAADVVAVNGRGFHGYKLVITQEPPEEKDRECVELTLPAGHFFILRANTANRVVCSMVQGELRRIRLAGYAPEELEA